MRSEQNGGKTMLQDWQQEEIRETIGEYANEQRTGYLSDSLNELVDSYLPVYYGEIIKEWQEMPSEYDNRGAEELGASDGAGIQDLMQLDLYLYYSDQVHTYAQEYAKENDINLDELN